ncbi:MAG: formylglycine-generating enzyme family protein [Myxococcales bacterium]
MRRISWAFSSLLALCAAWLVQLSPYARQARAVEQGSAVFIAPGWFTMGATQGDVEFARRLCVTERMSEALRLRGCANEDLFSEESPARRVYVSGFWLDRFELSRSEYAACVAVGACSVPVRPTEHPGLTHPRHPMVGISQVQAAEACRFRGGRLPSEAEWERGARGDSGRRFPWGNFHNEGLANQGGASPSGAGAEGQPSDRDGFAFAAPVDAFFQARSPHGLVQMAGNVWEWTRDTYVPLAVVNQRVNPSETRTPGLWVVRGGSFRSPAYALRVTHREPRPAGTGFVDVGVRCAYDAPDRSAPSGP